MEVLLDNDVIIKVAQFSLVAEFDRLLRANGCTRPYLCVPAAFGSLRVSEKIPLFTRFYPTDAVRKDAYSVYCMCEPLSATALDSSRLALLSTDPKMDGGEARLIDHACDHAESLILTGDKRCMIALTENPAFVGIHTILQDRFVHFESILEGMASMSSFAVIRGRVCGAGYADAKLAAALDMAHTEATARANLGARIQSLQGDTLGLMRDRF